MTKTISKQYAVACYFAARDNFREHPSEVWAADYFNACANRMKRVLKESGETGHPAIDMKLLAAAQKLMAAAFA